MLNFSQIFLFFSDKFFSEIRAKNTSERFKVYGISNLNYRKLDGKSLKQQQRNNIEIGRKGKSCCFLLRMMIFVHEWIRSIFPIRSPIREKCRGKCAVFRWFEWNFLQCFTRERKGKFPFWESFFLFLSEINFNFGAQTSGKSGLGMAWIKIK